MRNLLLLVVLLLGCSRETPLPSPVAATTTTSASCTEPEFALIELFTSEGCSSCPPADEIFNALPARSGARELIPIAWHVDYWNNLGYEDPFSSSSFTSRQHSYASALHARSVYTPELLINGVEYTGSRSQLEVSSREAVEDPGMVPLSLSVEGSYPSLRVRFDAHTAPAGARVIVVLVEDGLVQRVTGGENGGRTLHHDHVARSMKMGSGLSGMVTMDVPSDVVRAHASMVGFVERATDMRTLAAARVKL